MKLLSTGNYFGQQKKVIRHDHLIITDTEYTHDRVDWHYHENAYFTFLLDGRLSETNRKETLQLVPGSLLFHHWQDPHYNVKEPGFARGFHAELSKQWFSDNHIDTQQLEGSFQLHDPFQKKIFQQIYFETSVSDNVSELSIRTLLLQSITSLKKYYGKGHRKPPGWVSVVREILNDCCLDRLSLDDLAASVQIHPAHLSTAFPIYFGCTLGQYIRALRIERSIRLLYKKDLSISSIAYECGFSDESHFIRTFRISKGVTPAFFQRQLLR